MKSPAEIIFKTYSRSGFFFRFPNENYVIYSKNYVTLSYSMGVSFRSDMCEEPLKFKSSSVCFFSHIVDIFECISKLFNCCWGCAFCITFCLSHYFAIIHCLNEFIEVISNIFRCSHLLNK